jgi:hypothetical protein
VRKRRTWCLSNPLVVFEPVVLSVAVAAMLREATWMMLTWMLFVVVDATFQTMCQQQTNSRININHHVASLNVAATATDNTTGSKTIKGFERHQVRLFLTVYQFHYYLQID